MKSKIMPMVLILTVIAAFYALQKRQRSEPSENSQNVLPNIILISVDTLRADHVGCYGYPANTSPFIDRLAGEGVLFENAYSASSWTLPSHASILTGTLPSTHGAVLSSSKILDTLTTLPQCLRLWGYDTTGFVSTYFVRGEYGFSRGFNHYDDYTVELAITNNLFNTPIDWEAREQIATSPLIVRKVQKWSQTKRKDPFFLFLHFWDCHGPYEPVEPHRTKFLEDNRLTSVDPLFLDEDRSFYERYKEEVTSLYDGEISQVDWCIRTMYEHLEAKGLLDNTLIIFTSDHGEAFFEHGHADHGKLLYEEFVRVPLIFSWNNVLPRGVRRPETVSNASIMATILDLAGIPIPKTASVPSLAPMLNKKGRHTSNGSREPAICHLEVRKSWIVTARTDDWSVHWFTEDDRWELFDRSSDPYEKVNLAKDKSALKAVRKEQRIMMASVEGPQLQKQGEDAIPKDLIDSVRGLGYTQ